MQESFAIVAEEAFLCFYDNEPLTYGERGEQKMKLDEIGFPTMTDARARSASAVTPMIRCDMVLTDRCTFRCPYCRGIREDCRGSLNMKDAKHVIDLWTENGLQELRLTGGEPTVWPGLCELVRYAKASGVKSIGISTNGYSDLSLYQELIEAGVNDFSISLDACDPEEGDRMSGGIKGSWEKVTSNIREIAKRAYVVLGIVVTSDSAHRLPETIAFALSLGAHDIKLISASQYDRLLTEAASVSEDIRSSHPLLNYRISNMLEGRNIRSLSEDDSHRCPLVLDDSSYAGGFHFPCTLYMRERGASIGVPSETMRSERAEWYRNHDTHSDAICRRYCIDSFVDYNNRWLYFHLKDQKQIPVLAKEAFTEESYDPSLREKLGAADLRFDNAFRYGEAVLHHPEYRLLGLCLTDDMNPAITRPKHTALLYETPDGSKSWFAIRSSEMGELLGL